MTAIRYSENCELWAIIRSCIFRGLLFGALWWVLADGSLTSWPVGAVAIVLAVVVSFLAGGLNPKRARLSRARLGHWLAFLPYFMGKSVLGAIDVARRAYDPRSNFDAVFHDYPLRLSEEGGRVFFANTVSLLPGTLSAELRSRHLVVHVLGRRRPTTLDLASLEERVGQLFGQDLAAPETVQ